MSHKTLKLSSERDLPDQTGDPIKRKQKQNTRTLSFNLRRNPKICFQVDSKGTLTREQFLSLRFPLEPLPKFQNHGSTT